MTTFWGFVAERHRVWHLRDAGHPPPWTSDPVIASRRFTNVYRRLDLGTRYAVARVQEPCPSPEWAILRTLVYRWLNSPTTFEAVAPALSAMDRESFVRALDSVERPFGNAYVQSGQGVPPGSSLGARLWDGVVSPGFELCGSLRGMTPREALKALRGLDGYGGFLSWQALMDMSYPLLSLDGRRLYPGDLESHVELGPGAKEGLRKMGLPPTLASLMDLWSSQVGPLTEAGMPWLVEARVPGEWGRPSALLPSDVEHCLCEYQKYLRGGRSMRKYKSLQNIGAGLPRVSPWHDFLERGGVSS